MSYSISQTLSISFPRKPWANCELEPLKFNLIPVDQIGNDGDGQLSLTHRIALK